MIFFFFISLNGVRPWQGKGEADSCQVTVFPLGVTLPECGERSPVAGVRRQYAVEPLEIKQSVILPQISTTVVWRANITTRLSITTRLCVFEPLNLDDDAGVSVCDESDKPHDFAVDGSQ